MTKATGMPISVRNRTPPIKPHRNENQEGANSSASTAIACAVFVRGIRALALVAPHQIVVGIKCVVAGIPVSDLQIPCRRGSAVDEVMGIALARWVAGAHPCGQPLFAGVG